MEENVIDFVIGQKEEMKGIREWIENNKSCEDTMSVKLDLINDINKILMNEEDRIEGQVNSWETKLRKMEEMYG
jgi:DNA-binding FrmR family transcriptional regulator